MESARNAINNLMGNTENASCAPFLTDSQSLTYNSLQETLPTLERTPPGLKRMFPTLETMFPGPVQMILGWQKDKHSGQSNTTGTAGQSTHTGAAGTTGQSTHTGHTDTAGQDTPTGTAGTAGQTTHTGTAGQSTQTGPTSHTSDTSDTKQTSDSSDTKTGLHLHNPLHHHKSNESDDASSDRRNQSPEQGPDPALVGDANPKSGKLTGAGVDGSHSAVFGLTPDGHKHDDTAHGSAPPKPAHSKETEISKDKSDKNDDSSRAPAGAGVKEQMDAPDTAGKGLERTDPVPRGAGSDGKPGAGLSGAPQGSGDVPSH